MNSSAKNDICVFTVVYPSMEKWIPQFTESLMKQDFKAFDLVIVNDGLSLGQLQLLDELFNCTILSSFGSIVKNRNEGFARVLNSGYRYVVFADADDLMEENRISHSKELLGHSDIVVNDLKIIDSQGENILDKYLSRRLGNLKRIHSNEILDYNFMGLGNSSARVQILKDITIPDDVKVVDWYLFTILLNQGHNAVFTSSTSTLYRQHHSNLVGFHYPDENNIMSLAEQKYLHYLHLQKHSQHHHKRFIEFTNLLTKLKDPVFRRRYLEEINDQMPESPFWYESIKPE